MAVDEQVIQRISDIEGRLEALESQESRRLITDYDWLRGKKCDFLGDAIPAEFTSDLSGGDISLIDGEHGGIARLRSGNVNTNYARLWLGDAVGGYDTIRPQDGVVLIARLHCSEITNCDMTFGLWDIVGGNYLWIGLRTTVGNQWIVRCFDGGASQTASGILADTDWHTHAVEISRDLVNYWLDGTLIVTHTTNVPNATFMTPFAWACTRENAHKNLRVDFWGVIPRNLA